MEAGTLEAAKQIKKVNPLCKVLFYLNSMVHYGGYSANENFKDEWAMYNPKRKDYYKWRSKYLSYDHTNLEFREWWIQRALDMVSHDEIDGVFIDGIVKADARYLPTKGHNFAYRATADELRRKLPTGKILIGNGLRARTSSRDSYASHLEYLDGSYLEGWASEKNLAPTLDLMSDALKKGRIIMLSAGPDGFDQKQFNQIRSLDARYTFAGKPEYINFPLAYFLLVYEPHAYFSYHYGVDANPRRKFVWDNNRFEELTRRLGRSKGGYVRESKHEFSR